MLLSLELTQEEIKRIKICYSTIEMLKKSLQN